MDPSLPLQLSDAGVYEGEAGETGVECFEVGVADRRVPGDVDADLVVKHLTVIRVVDAHREKELAPVQLDDYDGWSLKPKPVC